MVTAWWLLLVLQADGFGMNGVTLGVMTAVAGVLSAVIVALWKVVTRDKERLERENEQLKEEKAALMAVLIDSLRTGHRATDTAEDATKELLKRRGERQSR